MLQVQPRSKNQAIEDVDDSDQHFVPGRCFCEPGASLGCVGRERPIFEVAVRSRDQRLRRFVDPRGVPASATETFETLTPEQQILVDTIKKDRTLVTQVFLPDALGLHDNELARRDVVVREPIHRGRYDRE